MQRFDGHHPAYIAYTHVREFLGTVVVRGWRPAFTWGLVLVTVLAYVQNLVSPINLEPYFNLALLIVGTFIWRGGVEKGGLAPILEAMLQRRFGIVPTGGMVNPQAIEVPPRGGPAG